MAKEEEKNPHNKVAKDKDKGNLVGRVKKVIKKSRRKLSEEKFEKELQRTIEFLEQMQAKLNNHQGDTTEKKAERRVVKKVETRAAKKTVKSATANRKKVDKPAAKNPGKKGKDAASKNKAAAAAGASQAETRSTDK